MAPPGNQIGDRDETRVTVATVTKCVELDREAALTALPIWRNVAQWLVDRGATLWHPGIFDEPFIDDARQRGIILGAIIEDRVTGVALLQWVDELWWPDRPPNTAGYVHKLAVDRRAAGRGVADALVHECERLTRARALPYTRLDTAADRPALRALYERLGYRLIDARSVNSLAGLRYEKLL